MFHAPASETKQQSDSARTELRSGNAPMRAQQPLAHLHSTYGNQAVLRMLSQSAPGIQAKLTVNEPGDVFEQEADRVADQVMRMPASVPAVQRKCSSCEEEDKVQRKCADCQEEEKKTGLQRKESSAGPQFAPPSVHAVLNSPGRPLDPVTRAFMEPRFGHDFSGVRVHTDASAANSARAVNALAYTAGQNIVFGPGQYSPGSNSGQRLLAHELTHVVQQSQQLCRAALPSIGGGRIAIGQRSGSTQGIQRQGDVEDPGSGPPAVPMGPTCDPSPCKCTPEPGCGDTKMRSAVMTAFGEAVTWFGPAEQKMTDYKAAPSDPANAAAAKALKAHFNYPSATPSLVPIDIPGIVLKVIKDLTTAASKCPICVDCPGTAPAGPEGGKVHAGSPNAWAKTNCYTFYDPFKSDKSPLAPQIVIHEMVHSWEGVGAVEMYEHDSNYPPPQETAQHNPDSFACLIRDLRK